MSLIDLHLHSNFSDGSDSVKELLDNIRFAGVKTFALTDHDTVAGCKEMARLDFGDIKFIPAVELTCIADNLKCHLLGYNCDYNNEKLLALIEKGKVLRRKKLEVRLKFLKDKWEIVPTKEELDWLYSRKSVVKTHIANILVNRGLATDNVSAMKKYLDGCKSGDSRFTLSEAVDAIKSSGGIPVWAHPLGGEGEAHDSEEKFMNNLSIMMKFGIMGLECYYSRYNQDEISFLVKQAKLNDLLITGGSDYHGKNKIGIKIAQLNVENSYVDSSSLSNF